METSEVSGGRLGEARTVRRYSLELAHAVREGSRRLDEALAEALGLYFEEPAGRGLANRHEADRAVLP